MWPTLAKLAARTETQGPGCRDWLQWLAAVFGAASLHTLLPSALAQQLLLLQLEPPMLRLPSVRFLVAAASEMSTCCWGRMEDAPSFGPLCHAYGKHAVSRILCGAQLCTGGLVMGGYGRLPGLCADPFKVFFHPCTLRLLSDSPCQNSTLRLRCRVSCACSGNLAEPCKEQQPFYRTCPQRCQRVSS